MKALVFVPGDAPALAEVDGFTGIQKTVGGYVERICLEPNVWMYLDEDGLLKGLPVNLWAEGALYRGNFVVGIAVIVHEVNASDGSSTFTDLPLELVTKYSALKRSAPPGAL